MNPGPAISTLRDDVARGQGGDDRLRELARLALRGLRKLQRRVGREIAVRGIARALDHRRSGRVTSRSSGGRAASASCTSRSIRYFKVLPSDAGREGRKSTEVRRPRRARNVNQYGCIFFRCATVARAAETGGLRLEDALCLPPLFSRSFGSPSRCSALAACNSDDDGSTGQISVAVTDSPVDYADAVVVQFTGVELKPKEGPAFSRDFATPKTIDLLAFQGEERAMLLDGEEVPGRRVHLDAPQGARGSGRGRRLLHHDRRRGLRAAGFRAATSAACR